MRLFRKSSAEPLAVSMVGIQLGNRLLVVGCGDPRLIAALAVRTGLTGRACAVDEDGAKVASAQAITEREGALVETFTAPVTMLPLEADAFDVVVIRNWLPALEPDRRSGCLREVLRVLRGGGRCLVVDNARGGLLGARRGPAGDYEPAETLRREGLKAVRVLTEREGLRFVEGVKPT